MTEFMHHDVVTDLTRRQQYLPIELQLSSLITAAPAGTVGLDRYASGAGTD